MVVYEGLSFDLDRFRLKDAKLPFKVLITAIIISMNLGMLGAFGQIIVHDLIPTFLVKNDSSYENGHSNMEIVSKDDKSKRGDLFENVETEIKEPAKRPIYKNEQFVWTLKFSHIHLFGMSMIFIFIGTVSLFLDLSQSVRSLLIGLPFIGIWIDIAAMWLKAFVSPIFFWLHAPAGSLFGIIFIFVSFRAIYEMWIIKKK